MVEYTLALDSIFGSLADPIRRDILQRVAKSELSVSEVARPYDITLAAVSKHLKILERAKLIIKHRRGKQQLIHISPAAFKDATDYLKYYESFLVERLDSLEHYIATEG